MKLINLNEVIEEEALKKEWRCDQKEECIGYFKLLGDRICLNCQELNANKEETFEFIKKLLATDPISQMVWEKLVKIYYPLDRRPIVILRKSKDEIFGDIRDFILKRGSEFGVVIKEGTYVLIEVCEI